MPKIKRISIFVFLILFCTLAFLNFAESKEKSAVSKLIIFYSINCHSCARVKNGVIPGIKKEFKDRLEVEYLDIGDIENYKMLVGLQKKYDPASTSNIIPVAYIEGKLLYGGVSIRNGLRKLIIESLGQKGIISHRLPSIDLVPIFKEFKPLVIIGAGLLDGVNPCAFTVIVFFISFLALQGYRRRELIAVGLTFITVVFITYLLIGLGIFGFLYRLEGFWLVSKIVNIAIGLLSIVLGIFALYDFFKFKKTGQTEGLALQLPRSIKDRIHSLIGMHYRVKGGQDTVQSKKHIIVLISSALVTGFLISLLESVCTGQIYLPTIVFILKTTYKLQGLAYLLLYNFMFIIPLLIIFLFALWGVTSDQFSKFLKEHLLTVKLLMAVLFFSLGFWLLIWRG